VDDVKLNGRLTLGENTADNGGVRVALMALEDTLKGKQDKVEGFTPNSASSWDSRRSGARTCPRRKRASGP